MDLRHYRRRGMSSVLTSLLMTAVVLSIGIGVWGYAQSASSRMSSDYFEEVMESVHNIRERFRVESIGVNFTSPPSVQVWVINYGKIQINITRIKISGGGNNVYYYPPDNDQNNPPNGVSISPKETVRFDFDPGSVPVTSGLSISIMVESARENKAYAREMLP